MKPAASPKTVRERNGAGPCTLLGPVLRETDRNISYRDRRGTQKFISKRWMVHTEPCLSCPDHPKTKYPDAFQDASCSGEQHRRRRHRRTTAFLQTISAA
jgi:hypothetical protein